MRSRIFSTLAALAVGTALTAGTVGAVASALGGGSDNSSTTHQAGKIMARLPILSTLGGGN